MLNSTEHEYIMLINVLVPTRVGIITFICMINTTSYSEHLKNNKSFFQPYSSYEQLKLHAYLSGA